MWEIWPQSAPPSPAISTGPAPAGPFTLPIRGRGGRAGVWGLERCPEPGARSRAAASSRHRGRRLGQSAAPLPLACPASCAPVLQPAGKESFIQTARRYGERREVERQRSPRSTGKERSKRRDLAREEPREKAECGRAQGDVGGTKGEGGRRSSLA